VNKNIFIGINIAKFLGGGLLSGTANILSSPTSSSMVVCCQAYASTNI
jgi:hypothetical protein